MAILLVDDDPLSRGALRRLIGLVEGVVVAGEAAGPEEAREGVRRFHPDAVLMDVHMGHVNGFQVTRDLVREHPGLRVLVVSVLPENPYAVEAFRAGASGFLRKEDAPRRLAEAIRTVVQGETYLSPAVAPELVRELVRSRASGLDFPSLTPREQEILELLAQGLSNKEIAAVLHSTVRTVKAHVSHVLEKLNVDDRTQAAVLALRLGLVRSQDAPYREPRSAPNEGR
ncbi:LuxR family transcriptional regulator [Limnochorda pilosa]|uniref:LuxR family transcriptional regulator n=1 Tax=Limnochorda pilosa TaxID=1555112 RepID=A0A0K2SNI6_LIMPI|nr:LuxR family transcriptional regulator [Limnochorda pilosa]